MSVPWSLVLLVELPSAGELMAVLFGEPPQIVLLARIILGRFHVLVDTAVVVCPIKKNTVSNLSVTLESFQSSIISIFPSSIFLKFWYCATSNFGLTLIVVIVCPETGLAGS